MAASDWPVWWVLVPPAMMLAFMAVCMMSMRCMMRGRPEGDRAGDSRANDPTRTVSNVPARFPEGQAPLEQLGSAEDKAEFDKFMAGHKPPPRGGPRAAGA
jgi:hypothetical protein